ncbi:hypothetical protein E4T49_01188 [Aureobasidium sp. EXF-10728]|nr:hypothetical protein E4T49_01188 [Aureobasidium sp. EXF-10728]
MASLAHKRKRDSLDHDVGHAPVSSEFKEFRGSPNGQVEYETPFLNHENDMPPHFADALVQHNAGDHGVHDHSLHDHNVHPQAPTNGQSASETANAALHYSMGVPQNHDESFLTHNDGHRESSATFSLEAGTGQPNPESYGEFAGLEQLKENAQPQQQQQQAPPQTSVLGPTEGSPSAIPSGSKPAVGTDEWHKVRRDNHKEGRISPHMTVIMPFEHMLIMNTVERRRRETINEGINELAKIVPGCEKNKGSILQRAVQFITQLKENESQNIEKWTLEKLLTEQAFAELSGSCDKLKAELNQVYKDLDAWKRCAQRSGLEPSDEDRANADGNRDDDA